MYEYEASAFGDEQIYGGKQHVRWAPAQLPASRAMEMFTVGRLQNALGCSCTCS